MNRQDIKLLLIILSGLLLFVAILNYNNAWGSGYYLTWDAPTTNADSTPLTDLAGYNVYVCDTECYVIDTVSESYFITELGLSQGWWLFDVTAFDTFGNESEYSDSILAYCFPVVYDGEILTFCVTG